MSASPDIPMLPRGWAPVLLVAVALLLVIGWYLGANAEPPELERPPPSLPSSPGPPAPVPD